MSTAQAMHIRPSQAIYLVVATDRGAEAAALRTLWDRRNKASTEKNALWSGHYELKRLAEDAINDAVSQGALLYLGQQAAVDEARRVINAPWGST